MALKSAALLFIIVGLVFLPACAGTKRTPSDPITDHLVQNAERKQEKQEKWDKMDRAWDSNDESPTMLREQLRLQAAEIVKLRRSNEILNARLRAYTAKSEPEKIKQPPAEEGTELHEKTGDKPTKDWDEDTTVAMARGGIPEHKIPQVPVKALVPPEKDEEEPLETSPTLSESESVVDSSQEVMHLYYRGLQLLHDKKYDEASNPFYQFVKGNPEHVYADRAQFLLMEAHYLSGEYGLAIVAANVLESHYPQSVKIPSAILRRAMSYAKLQQRQEAEQNLRQLVRDFPNAPQAQLASKKLAELSIRHKVPLLDRPIQAMDSGK
jgi:tol-pal system protein YbgF